MIRRIGTSENERQGVVLELYGNKKCVLRGWHNGCVMIPAVHIDLSTLAQFLGLQPPPKRKGGSRRKPVQRMEDGVPT